ncbi:MAG: dihydroorotate dehydrogenase [Hyphomicrobiales bacterium]|nr:dihydroorotate dehydrogenase [Hyphomicrobiales bacterium]
MTLIYKIAPRSLWDEAAAAGVFTGAPVDLADGYIHFSTATQTRETAAKHFAGQSDLVLAIIDAEALGEALKWEPSRGGDLFPHLYRALRLDEVASVHPLPLDANGAHEFGALLS